MSQERRASNTSSRPDRQQTADDFRNLPVITEPDSPSPSQVGQRETASCAQGGRA